MVAALQPLDPSAGDTALALLRSTQPPPPQRILTPLLNVLHRVSAPVVLALDDYHVVDSPPIHDALTWLIDHRPPALHVLIASRVDPPLPLARWRARGQLAELRGAELRCTPAETAVFLTATMRLQLSPDEIATLGTRTESWIAGLQLAALALRNHAHVPGFISAFTGSNRFVVDYLAHEVFAHQPPHLQAFLLHTAILDRMCGPLCDAVLGLTTDDDHRPIDHPSSNGDSYSHLLVEQLERANVFTIALDDTRTWYRYHQLFAEVIRARLLRGATAAEVATLQRRASVWYEQQGLVAEAVQHALAAQDWARTARVIEEHGLVLVLSGHVRTVLGWLDAVPAAIREQRPILCLIHATGLMFTNQFDAAEARLQDGEPCVEPATPDELAGLVRGSVALVRGNIRHFAGDWAQALRLMQHAVADVPDTPTTRAAGIISTVTRTVATLILGTAYSVTGDVTASSERWLADAIAPVQATGNLSAALTTYTYLAALRVLQGRLRAAAATYAEVERLFPGQDTRHALVNSAAYYFGLGEVWREWSELAAAEDYLRRGMTLVKPTAVIEADVLLLGYLALAQTHSR